MSDEIKIEGPCTIERGARIFPSENAISPNTITLWAGGVDVIKLCGNGDIYVRGELMENNLQLLEAFKSWLKECNVNKL